MTAAPGSSQVSCEGKGEGEGEGEGDCVSGTARWTGPVGWWFLMNLDGSEPEGSAGHHRSVCLWLCSGSRLA